MRMIQPRRSDRSPGAHAGDSRRRFMGRSLATAAAVAGSATLAGGPTSAEAQTIGGVESLRLYFTEIFQNETNHVKFLTDVLGPNRFDKPEFIKLRRDRYADFANQARIFENTGTKAYLGATPLLSNSSMIAVASSIALIEARQASWLNSIFPGMPIRQNNESFESPLNPQQVAQAISPYFANKAIPTAFANAIQPFVFSAANDIAIMRFAYLQELLELEFYQINYPRFFG